MTTYTEAQISELVEHFTPYVAENGNMTVRVRYLDEPEDQHFETIFNVKDNEDADNDDIFYFESSLTEFLLEMLNGSKFCDVEILAIENHEADEIRQFAELALKEELAYEDVAKLAAYLRKEDADENGIYMVEEIDQEELDANISVEDISTVEVNYCEWDGIDDEDKINEIHYFGMSIDGAIIEASKKNPLERSILTVCDRDRLKLLSLIAFFEL